jgi:glycosyltransferase involved in cell wall biosynthesis
MCLSSNRSESCSNVVGEAVACGVPCAVTDAGDSALIVSDSGKVVPPSNALALAQACRELIAMGAEGRARLGTLARQRIVGDFSFRALVNGHPRLFEQNLRTARAR